MTALQRFRHPFNIRIVIVAFGIGLLILGLLGQAKHATPLIATNTPVLSSAFCHEMHCRLIESISLGQGGAPGSRRTQDEYRLQPSEASLRIQHDDGKLILAALTFNGSRNVQYAHTTEAQQIIASFARTFIAAPAGLPLRASIDDLCLKQATQQMMPTLLETTGFHLACTTSMKRSDHPGSYDDLTLIASQN